MTLDRKIEDILEGSLQKTEISSFLALEPNMAERLLKKLQESVEAVTPKMEVSPILLISPSIRIYLRRLTERFLPDLPILSHSEITPSVQIKTLKVIDLNAN